MPRKTDKRIRLVEAAKDLIHKDGYDRTTLANIADEATVPLGNVYYYFKTKVQICQSVIDSLAKELQERLQAWDKIPDIKDRLLALLRCEVERAELTARSGCPIGGLCQELAKQGGLLAAAAAKLLNDMIEWTEKQFRALGYGEKAREFSLQFIAGIQGAALLTNTFKDPKLATMLTRANEQWLENLATTRTNETVSQIEEDAVA